MDKKQKHTTKEERIEVWTDLLVLAVEYLPLPNKHVLIDTCLRIAKKNGYFDEFENPFFLSEDYAMNKWRKIVNETASSHGVFIRFITEDGSSFRGSWDRVYKFELIKSLTTEYKNMSTRSESYNYIVETAKSKYKGIQLPLFTVKQLPG